LLQANRIAYAGLCEFNQLSCDHCRQDVSPVNKPKRLQHVLKDGTQSGNLCGLKALLSFQKFRDWHTSAAQNYFIRTARVFRKDGVHGPTPFALGPQLTSILRQSGAASLFKIDHLQISKNMNIVPQHLLCLNQASKTVRSLSKDLPEQERISGARAVVDELLSSWSMNDAALDHRAGRAPVV
jgi:hypothetical protein